LTKRQVDTMSSWQNGMAPSFGSGWRQHLNKLLKKNLQKLLILTI